MSRRFVALGAAALTSAAIAVPALAQGQGQGNTTTLTFTELDKGSTFHIVDNKPFSKLKHGFPAKMSAGDGFVTTAPLADGTGATIGQLRASCTATHAAKVFEKAGFICTGDFVFTDGSTLTAHVADLAGTTTKGAVLGGTGKYANARGTFTSTEQSNNDSADVVTLVN